MASIFITAVVIGIFGLFVPSLLACMACTYCHIREMMSNDIGTGIICRSEGYESTNSTAYYDFDS